MVSTVDNPNVFLTHFFGDVAVNNVVNRAAFDTINLSNLSETKAVFPVFHDSFVSFHFFRSHMPK